MCYNRADLSALIDLRGLTTLISVGWCIAGLVADNMFSSQKVYCLVPSHGSFYLMCLSDLLSASDSGSQREVKLIKLLPSVCLEEYHSVLRTSFSLKFNLEMFVFKCTCVETSRTNGKI